MPRLIMERIILIRLPTAESKGPGIQHHPNDSGDDYDIGGLDSRARIINSRGGRIILLGNGAELHTDPEEDDADCWVPLEPAAQT